jgi:hypothetical protein
VSVDSGLTGLGLSPGQPPPVPQPMHRNAAAAKGRSLRSWLIRIMPLSTRRTGQRVRAGLREHTRGRQGRKERRGLAGGLANRIEQRVEPGVDVSGKTASGLELLPGLVEPAHVIQADGVVVADGRVVRGELYHRVILRERSRAVIELYQYAGCLEPEFDPSGRERYCFAELVIGGVRVAPALPDFSQVGVRVGVRRVSMGGVGQEPEGQEPVGEPRFSRSVSGNPVWLSEV